MNYCLHYGWTLRTEEQVVAAAISEAAERPGESTGDLTVAADVEEFADLGVDDQAQAERRELMWAASSVSKAKLLLGETGRAGGSSARVPIEDYPQKYNILDEDKVEEQHETYWCGPTSFQMIEWNWDGSKQSQNLWAGELGTTSDGTSISRMVQELNQSTGWDNESYAGDYIVLDVSQKTFDGWYSLNYKHYYEYRAPVVLHPVLKQEYFPYLDQDGSGHFQVGRGYDFNAGGTKLLSYFEPWNQQRFDPSERFIARVQNRAAIKSFNANQAHFQQNIGV